MKRKEKAKLPVLVWVHGGGYGFGNGQQDMTEIINDNDNSFIAVSIQYRVSLFSRCIRHQLIMSKLGAFGFLSSTEIQQNGALNAGPLAQGLELTDSAESEKSGPMAWETSVARRSTAAGRHAASSSNGSASLDLYMSTRRDGS